jgi:hypothetical protein
MVPGLCDTLIGQMRGPRWEYLKMFFGVTRQSFREFFELTTLYEKHKSFGARLE